MRLTIHNDVETLVSGAFRFAEYIHKLGNDIPKGGTGALWFRGQADVEWELKPSVGRTVDHGGLFDLDKGKEALYQTEAVVLQRFKRDGYPYMQRLLTDWEAITLGQHFQLPTRLLDWTSNPLVALFFAAEAQPDKDGAVYAYRPRNVWDYHISMFYGQNPQNREVPNPLEISGIKIVFPMLMADRLILQAAGFTIQDPLVCLMKRGDEDFDEKSLDVFEIYKWTLPKSLKGQVLEELHRVSINRRNLFPTLDGVGHGLREQERFRRVRGTWNTP